MITDESRSADVEFSDETLEIRVVIQVSENADVPVSRVLNTTHNVLAGAMAALGHPTNAVSAMLAEWHTERAAEAREAEDF